MRVPAAIRTVITKLSVMITPTHLPTLALVLLILSVLAQDSSCGRTSTNGTRKTVNGNSADQMRKLQGQWGGADIALEVTSEGIDVNFDCAHGHIEDLFPDSAGNFSVKGTYVREHGGAMRINENPDSLPAVYKGKISENQMTLTVTFPDGTEDVGPFKLERGKSGRVHKCM